MERVFSAIFDDPERQKKLREYLEKRDRDALIPDARSIRSREARSGSVDALKLMLRFMFRGFCIGYGGQVGLAALYTMYKRPAYGVPSHIFTSLRTLRFGVALGLVVGWFRGALCLLRQRRRRLRVQRLAGDKPAEPKEMELVMDAKQDRRDRRMAGAIAGLGLFIAPGGQRKTIALYTFVRALDVQRHVMEKKGQIPTLPFADAMIFGIINMPLMSAFLLDPSLLTPSYHKWILWMGQMKENLIAEMMQHGMTSAGRLYPVDPGRRYLIYDWFYGLGRATRMYAPVHILPMVLFRHKQLLSETLHEERGDEPPQSVDPVATMSRTAKSVAGSAMFLTSYQFIVKSVTGMLREDLMTGDTWWKCAFAGYCTSFGTVFESDNRIKELCLYCAPHAYNVLWDYGQRRGWIQPFKYGELLLFMPACALIFGTNPQDFKPTYQTLTHFLVDEAGV